jgi:hypothetical protein
MTQADLNTLKIRSGEDRRFHCTATSILWHTNRYPVNMQNGRFEPFIADKLYGNLMHFRHICIEFKLEAKVDRADCRHQFKIEQLCSRCKIAICSVCYRCRYMSPQRPASIARPHCMCAMIAA